MWLGPRPAMRRSAPASAAGSRVYCAALASARNSRCRLTAACRMRPKKAPSPPTTSNSTPNSAMPARPSSFLDREAGARAAIDSTTRPISMITITPATAHASRTFSRVSPCAMWLNSCATTPCSSSRGSCAMAPLVKPSTASLGVLPAANALMESSSITYTGGTGMPLAIDISSTTSSRRRSEGDAAAGFSQRPPSDSATALPPPRSCMRFTPAPSRMIAAAAPKIMRNVAGSHQLAPRAPPRLAASDAIAMATGTYSSTPTPISDSTNITTRRRVARLAAS